MSDASNTAQTPQRSWFNGRVLGGALVGLLLLSFARNYIDLYLHLDLAFLNQLPFGLIIYVAAIASIWNPICTRLWKSACFNGSELLATLILCMVMVWGSSAFPGHWMVAPHQLKSGELLWQKYELVEQIPEHLYPLAGDNEHEDYEQVFDNYAQGMSQKDSIPWQHLIAPFIYWMPLFIIFGIIIISISWLVHRQWSQNEQLNYPLAQIAHGIFDKDDSRRFPNIFYSRMMWIAAAIVVSIHGYGLFLAWFPGALPPLQLHGRFNFLWSVFIILNRTGSWWLVDFHVMFSVIGVAYFLSKEVGLTLALSQVLLLVFSIQYYLNTGSVINGNDIEYTRKGAYIAYGMIILITGRHYYLGLLKKAFGKDPDVVKHESATIVRIFLAANVALLLYLILIFELDYFLAILLVASILLCALVFARLVCEVGGPYIQGQWGFTNMFLGVMGPTAIGPAGLMAIMYVSQTLSVNGNGALMPFVSNGLQIADKAGLNKKRLFGTMIIALIAVVVGAFIFKTMYFYEYGAQSKYAHANSFDGSVKGAIKPIQSSMEKMGEFGQIETSKETTGLAKLAHLAPDAEAGSWIVFGAIGVVVFFFLRIRFAWWPLHPILFLVWNTFPIMIFYWSFFFGWCLKSLVVKFGGGSVYQKAKPFFIGLIIGDIIAFALTGIIAILYAIITGDEPVVYRVYRFF